VNISSLRDGLKTRLATISGLRAYDVIPDNFAPPAVIVAPPMRIQYAGSLGNAWASATFTVRLLVAKATDRSAQDRLDAYLDASGASSIAAAIEADTSLSGAANLARVLTCQGIGVYDYSGVPLLGAEFTIEVLA
jgi:hypothetical protein